MRRASRAVFSVGAFALIGLPLGGCDDAEPAATAAVSQPASSPIASVASAEAAAARQAVQRGRALIETYECNRCHEIDGVEKPTLDLDCVGCHEEIVAGQFEAEPEQLATWQASLVSFLDVPTLSHTERFRRAWIGDFLQSTHALRPNLPASMPHLEITREDAEAIAAFLVPTAETEHPALGDPDRGRAVMERKGCASCHRFTGVPPLPAMPPPIDLDAQVLSRGQKLAPDLRYARDRLRPAALVQWLRDPAAAKPDSAMPKIPMSDEEILDAAAYLLQAPQTEPVSAPMPARLPVLTRPVSYAEVDARVFSKTCRHCHAGPEVVAGGGPGYAGGFGFRPRKLDLSSYTGILQGSLDDEGRRHSLFEPLADGTPRLVAHLWARHAEATGRLVEGARGMPLGLPPLSLEDIQLVETWIAQGRPR